MFSYEIYGLSVQSDVALEHSQTFSAMPPDVRIQIGSRAALRQLLDGSMLQSTGWCEHAYLPDGSTYIRCPDVAEFRLSADGSRVLCSPDRTAMAAAWQTYLLAQVLSFALVKRGLEPLHATAVVVDGEAFGLLGESGQGKSTLAAAFLQHGHRLLTDDLLTVRQQDQAVMAFPGPPRIKLLPGRAANLLGVPAPGVPMNPFTAKLVIPLQEDQLQRASVPLRALYVLESPTPTVKTSERPRISELPPRHAVMELVKHTFNRVLVDRPRLQRQFDSAIHLASQVPVKTLAYRRGLAHLPEVRQALLTDLAGAPRPL